MRSTQIAIKPGTSSSRQRTASGKGQLRRGANFDLQTVHTL